MLDITTSTVDDSTVLSAVGDIDLHTSGAFREQALAAIGVDPTRLVLDLRRVGFIDSTGIGVMVLLHRRTESRRGELHVTPSRRVAAALRLSNLDRVLVLYDSLDGALSGELDDPA